MLFIEIAVLLKSSLNLKVKIMSKMIIQLW